MRIVCPAYRERCDSHAEARWRMAHPIGVKTLVPIQLLLAAISIPSGLLLLYSPGGEALGAQAILPHLTRQLSFITDFTPVGVFLLVVYGVVPLTLAYGLWVRTRLAWELTTALGITEVLWIAAEVILFYDFGFFIFYPIIAGMGIATLLLCLLPSVRRFYGSPLGEENVGQG